MLIFYINTKIFLLYLLEDGETVKNLCDFSRILSEFSLPKAKLIPVESIQTKIVLFRRKRIHN